MANVNIVDDLTALGAAPAVDDYVLIIDKSTGQVKSVTTANLVKVSKSAFALTLLDDADAAALLTTIGLDTDLLTLALPASTTISAFIKTLLDDADAATARATLGGLTRIKTGTYTGDDSEGQAITGIGFQPKYVRIWQHPIGEAATYLFEKADVTWGDYAFRHASGGGHNTALNQINSLDADGFTVDDNAGDEHPNKDTIVYDYLAFG